MPSSEAFNGGSRFARAGRRRTSIAVALVAICAAGAFASPAMASTGLNWSGREKLGSGELLSIECPSAGLCLAGGTRGEIFSSAKPTGGESSWEKTVLPHSGDLDVNGIACPDAHSCTAVGGDRRHSGLIAQSSSPAAGADRWTVHNVDAALLSVSCPEKKFCAGVANGGKIVTWSDLTKSPPQIVTVDPYRGIRTITCTSASFCIAGDFEGEVLWSSNPTGAADAWHIVRIDRQGGIDEISCPTSKFCVAADDSGHVIRSTNPSGTEGDWNPAGGHIDGRARIWGIACPSTDFCAAVDEQGLAATSTNPTADSWKWTLTKVAPNSLGGISCPSVDFCAAQEREREGVYIGSKAAVAANSGIVSGPDGRTSSRRPTFAFSSTQVRSRFQCRLDSGHWRRCRSPHRTRRLRLGRHVFRVRAVTGGRVERTPAVRRFRVVRGKGSGNAVGATSSRQSGPIAFVRYERGFPGIYLMDPDGTHKHRISPRHANDFDPAFSPSGTRLAYTTNGAANGRIAIMHRNGSHRRRLARGLLAYAPSFAPSGRRLAFYAFRHRNTDIYTMAAGGRGLRRLTTARGYDEDPAYSPSGRLIAYDSVGGRRLPNFGLLVMRTDGTHRMLLDREGYTPSFSPNGRNIVYGGTDSHGLGQLMTIHPNGTHRRQLTDNSGGRIEYEKPRYSPNGKRIVFTRVVVFRNSENTDLFQIHADGSHLERLTHGGVSSAPSWGVEPR